MKRKALLACFHNISNFVSVVLTRVLVDIPLSPGPGGLLEAPRTATVVVSLSSDDVPLLLLLLLLLLP